MDFIITCVNSAGALPRIRPGSSAKVGTESIRLGLTCFHLDSLGYLFNWTHLGALGLTWTDLDSLGITWTHLDSLWI